MTDRVRFDAVDIASLPRLNPLFRDYLKGSPELGDFFRWDPRKPQDQIVACLTRQSYPRDHVVTVLTDQNRAWGAHDVALQGIARLRDPRAVTIVTGQQVGIFGGPLYTLYKALTAVALARQVESQWQIPCLPLFWMDAEDTDFAEIDHLSMPDHQDEVKLLRYAPPQGYGSDLPATHKLSSTIGEVIAALEQATGQAHSQEHVLKLLRESYSPGATLVHAFARLLSTLLSDRGLILADPSDARFKALARPLFLRETDTAPVSARLVQTASEKLRELGYRPQVKVRGEGPNLFYLDGEGRHPIKEGDHGVLRGGTRTWRNREELALCVKENPEHFSPNVVLRPVMESFLFPVLAHIGGPHEIAYYAQLRGVFDHFDIPMPLVLPRATLTLVEGRIERLLKKHNLTLPALQGGPERVVSRVLRASLPRTFVAKQQRILGSILKHFQELKAMVSALDPTLAPRAGRAEGAVKKQMEALERDLLRSYKRRNQELQTQVRRVQTHLLPGGQLQERVYGFMPYLCRHGLSLIELIMASIDGPGRNHRILYLGASR